MCPRCSGILLGNDDVYGHYASCLMCGWNSDVLMIPAYVLEAALNLDDEGNQLKQRRREPSHAAMHI